MPTTEQVLRFLQTLFPGQLVLYPPQLAQVIGRSEKALKHLIDRGTLPFEGRKIGNRWCVDVFRLAEWLALSAEPAVVSPQNPTNPTSNPTKSRRTVSSSRGSLGSKLLEMRQVAASAMRRSVTADAGGAAVVQEFILELLQPAADDHLKLEASLAVVGEGDATSEVLSEAFETLAAAAERVADLRSRPDVVAGVLRVSRSENQVYECSLEQVGASDWRVLFESDERFSALLGWIEHQAQTPLLVSNFSDARVPADWLARQSLAVRREVQSLCAFGVDADFFSQLAATVTVVQDADLVPLYHDAWCLPSKRVFEFAIANHWTADALTRCINDAEAALSTPGAIADFELFFPPDAEPEAAVNWLREYAYRSRLD